MDPSNRQPGTTRSTFAALRERNYRLYWLGLVCYVLGHRAEYVTFAWMVWEVTHDPLYLGYLGLAQGVPLVVFQLFGGVLADRVNRLRLLIGTQVLTAATLAAAFALSVTGRVSVEHLLALAALSSTFRAFDEPTRLSLIPQLVERDRLANAIALGSIPWQASRLVLQRRLHRLRAAHRRARHRGVRRPAPGRDDRAPDRAPGPGAARHRRRHGAGPDGVLDVARHGDGAEHAGVRRLREHVLSHAGQHVHPVERARPATRPRAEHLRALLEPAAARRPDRRRAGRGRGRALRGGVRRRDGGDQRAGAADVEASAGTGLLTWGARNGPPHPPTLRPPTRAARPAQWPGESGSRRARGRPACGSRVRLARAAARSCASCRTGSGRTR